VTEHYPKSCDGTGIEHAALARAHRRFFGLSGGGANQFYLDAEPIRSLDQHIQAFPIEQLKQLERWATRLFGANFPLTDSRKARVQYTR